MVGIKFVLLLLLSQLWLSQPLHLAVSETKEDFSIDSHNYLDGDFTDENAALLESTDSTVMIGVGYSDDLQQLTEQPCFNATVASISEREGSLGLDQAITFSELQRKMEVDVSASGGWGIFSGKGSTTYMRSIQDKDYSMSLNYFASVSEKVTLKIGDEPFTESGKRLYNNSNNRYFGLVCGDHYVASYKQGALLTMGLNVELNSHEEKKVFTTKIKIKVGPFNLFRATQTIQTISTTNKISGTVTLRAFQIGGEPSKLANLLNNNVVKCNITATQECSLTASKLLEYGKTFGTQIENSTRLEPLVYTHHPIKWIGLKPAVSLVTPEIAQYRKYLLARLEENQYYIEKFRSFYEGYPVTLHNAFFENANSVLAKVEYNIGVLRDPRTGAGRCYNDPEQCKEIKTNIDARLQDIMTDDLQFLEDVKFTVPIDQGEFFFTGNKTKTSWILKPIVTVTVKTVEISDKSCIYMLLHNGNTIVYNGNCNSTSTEYTGSHCIDNVCRNNVAVRKVLSPFYFKKYSIVSE